MVIDVRKKAKCMRAGRIIVAAMPLIVGACNSIQTPGEAISAAARACPDFFRTKKVSDWTASPEGDHWKVSPKDGETIWVTVKRHGKTTADDCMLLVPD